MSVNKVILIGNLGHDASMDYVGEKPVTKFSLATNEKWTDKTGQKKKLTEWHRITVWGKQAEACKTYLKKGSTAYVEGKLQTKEWIGKDGTKKTTTEVIASTVKFLGGNHSTSSTDDIPFEEHA